MENGILILNKLKEIQNESQLLKKSFKEIYDETNTCIKEHNGYLEEIKSNKLILFEKKKKISQIESNHELLCKSFLVKEVLLRNMEENVNKEEENLRTDHLDMFNSRNEYCDSVYKFIEQNERSDDSTVNSDSIYIEFEKLTHQILHLEEEIKMLEKNIVNKEASTQALLLLKENQMQEETRYQKLTKDKKLYLKNIMQKLKILKNEKRKKELNATIENLYNQKNDQIVLIDDSNRLDAKVSHYFSSIDKNKTQHAHVTSSKPSTFKPKKSSNMEKIFPENSENNNKRLKINNESSSSSNYLNSRDIKEETGTKKKFIPKQPFLSKIFD